MKTLAALFALVVLAGCAVPPRQAQVVYVPAPAGTAPVQQPPVVYVQPPVYYQYYPAPMYYPYYYPYYGSSFYFRFGGGHRHR